MRPAYKRISSKSGSFHVLSKHLGVCTIQMESANQHNVFLVILWMTPNERICLHAHAHVKCCYDIVLANLAACFFCSSQALLDCIEFCYGIFYYRIVIYGRHIWRHLPCYWDKSSSTWKLLTCLSTTFSDKHPRNIISGTLFECFILVDIARWKRTFIFISQGTFFGSCTCYWGYCAIWRFNCLIEISCSIIPWAVWTDGGLPV